MTSINHSCSPPTVSSKDPVPPVVSQMPQVLLVDDEAMVRDNLSAFLDDEGFSVVTVASAEEGLRWLQGLGPNIPQSLRAIVDMRLPGMSGEEFIRHAYDICPALRCIIHTGSLEYALPEDLLAQGMRDEDILHKPIGDLTQMVNKLHEPQ